MPSISPVSLLFSVFACVAAASPVAAPSASAARPNLLLIVTDDMGYGDLSCYGSSQIRTPNIDRLATGGVRCTAGYVSNSVCAPSRAGLLTGRSGSRFGFEHNLSRPDYVRPEFAGIPLDEPLIADRLKALGYRTGMIGKWHLGDSLPAQHPNARGFDYFFGMLGGGHAYFPKPDANDLDRNGAKVTSIRVPYLTDWFTTEALEFMRGEGAPGAGDPAKPWFLYLAYNTPHTPMEAKPEDLAKYAHISPKTRRTNCAMQDCLDQNIGKILDDLRARGRLDNTLIVFVSDNGGSVEASYAVNAPLRGGKGTFFEGGIRVPTIYHWPAQLRPAVYDKPVSSLDFMATFVAAAGGVPPEPGTAKKRTGLRQPSGRVYDSVNLLPYLRGESSGVPHETLFWRTALRGSAVRHGDWKLLVPNNQPAQLYHLSDDLGETRDLAAERPDLVRELVNRRIDWEVSLERSPMFMSDPYYTDVCRRLYNKTYRLTQPAPGDTEDVWTLFNAR